jgi:hypothetical protein
MGRLVIIRELVRRLMKYLVHQILNSITLNICYGCLIIFESSKVGESVRLGVMSDSVYNHVIYYINKKNLSCFLIIYIWFINIFSKFILD